MAEFDSRRLSRPVDARAAKPEGHVAHHEQATRLLLRAGVDDDVVLIVETYQGGFGLLKDVTPVAFQKADVIDLISSEGKWIAANRDNIARGNCSLVNLIDGLVGQYMRSYYKLTKLR